MCAADRKMKRGDGLPLNGGYDPLLEADYTGHKFCPTWWETQEFDGKCLEELGFRPKSRVFRSVTDEDKEAVRKAAVALRQGAAQLPTGTNNVGYYLSHYILSDRFNQSESIYILSLVVAEQERTSQHTSSAEAQVLLNEQEEEGGSSTLPEYLEDPQVEGIQFSDMSQQDSQAAWDLLQMFEL